jgi:hypothetical protein
MVRINEGRQVGRRESAVAFNEQGRQPHAAGDIVGAETAYRAAIAAAPEWSVPVYNLGLVPLPASGFHWGDIVLNDRAIEGERVVSRRAITHTPMRSFPRGWRPRRRRI